MRARGFIFAVVATLFLAEACSSGPPPATQPLPFPQPPSSCGDAPGQCPCSDSNAPEDTVFCGTCSMSDVPASDAFQCLYCPSGSVCRSVETPSSEVTFSGTCPVVGIPGPSVECVEETLPPTCPDSAPILCENLYPAPSGCCPSGTYCCVGGCCDGEGPNPQPNPPSPVFDCIASNPQVQCTFLESCSSCSISVCGGPDGSSCSLYETSDGQSFGCDASDYSETCITNAANAAIAHCGCS
jgi:hypothetical protein